MRWRPFWMESWRLSVVGGYVLVSVGHTASQGELILLLGSQYVSRCKLEAMVIRKGQDCER
jgi:hypothetical protein